jgi:glycosyltransferase involved in cell wall biosynthesis
MPTVSVVIPTFNRTGLLREAVGSVFAQTYTDWELLIADDGSGDETRAYLATLDDPRVTVILNAHGGGPAAMRNRAVARARGEWVAFLDSDDLWMPGKLALQTSRLASEPDCDWSCTAFGFIDAIGARIRQRSGVPYDGRGGWILERLLTFDATASIQTLMVRRSVFVELGGMDERFASRADYEFELRLAARSAICALPEVLSLIRVHPERMTVVEELSAALDEFARAFHKAEHAATSRSVRRLCRRQRAAQLATMVGVASRAGRHREAFAALSSALRAFPTSHRVWRSALAAIMRAARRVRPPVS